MTDQEKINLETKLRFELFDEKCATQNARIEEQGRRIDATLAELKEQRQDIRDLNKKIDDNFKQMMIGVGGMMIALGAFLVAVLR